MPMSGVDMNTHTRLRELGLGHLPRVVGRQYGHGQRRHGWSPQLHLGWRQPASAAGGGL